MVAGDQIQKYPTMAEILEELKRMKDIGFPVAAINLVGCLKGVVSVVVMGRLGRLELAGGALAIGFTNITGYSVLSGLALGMEPVCSQGFGSRNLPLVTLTLRRTIVMLLCASIPIALLWINLQPIMQRLHHRPDIAHVAGLYCLFALPDLVANSLLHPWRIYLRCNGTPEPLMWCTLLSLLVHLLLTPFLAITLHLGVAGVSIASFCTNFCTLLLLLCYMLCTRDTNKPLSMSQPPLLPTPKPHFPSTRTGEEWIMLIRLAFPSSVAVCLEWWWYEFMTLLAGYLSDPHVALATSAIVIQTTSLMYTLPMALSASVSTRVGNELGAGRPNNARLATLVAMLLAFLVSVVGLLWTVLGKGPWGRVFTQDSDVLNLTMAALPIIGLCELANCPQTTGCGVLRGSARPSISAAINLYSFYFVGTPVAIVLAFVFKLGFVGLCYGLLTAQIACAISIVTVICKTNWDKESLRAKELVGRGACIHQEEEDQTVKSGEEAEFLKVVAIEP
ncbi:Multi antimicrobial extrusion protein [Cinnamomum micranthum f. kanehirae]|uniref:Protein DETOXIFICATION n=1 Tax=Cinnamomum micranthum f. kanehirae TaxID=337451 RepID=A0A443PV25_9MAGN|nr:Multi antimicrobial extrusion protein [Cinnamomum micranthum f. kanehirae]